PVPEATEDSGITTVVTASDGTVISDTEVADVVETEEDAAEVTATEEAVETAEEVESMTASPDGVEVRLTQLQERIERAIAHGEEIIATASADNASVESLQASLDALVALKAEAAAIPTTGDVSEITAQFVAVKKAVIDAVKDFRTEARKLIKENKRAALKARMEAKAEARTARLEAKINSAKKRYNAEVTETVLARFGEEGATIAAKIESGEISAKDARKEIVAAYKSLSSDKKSEARQKLTERKAEIKVKRSAAVEKAKERTVEEVKTRGKKNE
ncbi:MAG TPA: hypothetical protein VKE88_02290, partial [Candidatus Nanoarchaeia archaeon]|nr:hypothetical protein [Candidatus Nanoarchaeia archaeon]